MPVNRGPLHSSSQRQPAVSITALLGASVILVLPLLVVAQQPFQGEYQSEPRHFPSGIRPGGVRHGNIRTHRALPRSFVQACATDAAAICGKSNPWDTAVDSCFEANFNNLAHYCQMWYSGKRLCDKSLQALCNPVDYTANSVRCWTNLSTALRHKVDPNCTHSSFFHGLVGRRRTRLFRDYNRTYFNRSPRQAMLSRIARKMHDGPSYADETGGR